MRRGIPGPQMRGTGGTHSLLRERGRGGAGGVDFRGLVEGAGLKDEEGAIGGDGEAGSNSADRAGIGEEGRGKAGGNALAGAIALQAEADETMDAVGELAGEDVLVVAPGDPFGGCRTAGSEIARLAAGGRDDPDVAAGDALIAHEAADEGDGFAVGRPAGMGDLEAVEGAGDIGGRKDRGGLGLPGPQVRGTGGTRAIPGLRSETGGTHGVGGWGILGVDCV